MEDDKPLTVWEIIKGIYFLLLTFAGAFALANLIFPFSESSNGVLLGFLLWMVFVLMYKHEVEDAFWRGWHNR